MNGKRKSIKRYEVQTNKVARLTNKERKRLDVMTDADIDYSDIANMSAELEKLYRPIKKTVTIRLDADVILWLKQKHPRYQTAVNRILREYMREYMKAG